MAGRNDRNMKRKVLFTLLMGLFASTICHAQENAHLKKLTDGVLQLRQSKASSKVLNQLVLDWSTSSNPKITLMDDINRDEKNEYRGKEANMFKMNQLVTHVYNRQNTGMVSKGDYFNSTEKDVYYSAIEKTVKPQSTVTYTLTGHEGMQEFVFIPFKEHTKFSAIANNEKAKPVNGKSGVLYITLSKVKKEDKIVFSITNQSGSPESFVILNYNPQK